MTTDERHGDVTYSPQDDKLRVYFALRQNAEDLAPLKAAGFRWAPRQECWHAHWSPDREDAALAVTGADALDDEPSTLEDRAADRSERFAGYAANASKRADDRMKRDRQVSEQLNGQPIIVGHHSEKGHRALLRRAWANFMKAGEERNRSDYWSRRAGAPEAWARYKDKPGVRARRIKKLEADARRFRRRLEDLDHLRRVCAIEPAPPYAGLRAFLNVSRAAPYAFWSRLLEVENGTDEQKAERAREVAADGLAHVAKCSAPLERWVAHVDGRVAYERVQLGEQGATALLDPKPRKKLPPLLNVDTPDAHRMTAAEYGKVGRDYKGVKNLGSYRRRRVMHRSEGSGGGPTLSWVFLTDRKAHEAPGGES